MYLHRTTTRLLARPSPTLRPLVSTPSSSSSSSSSLRYASSDSSNSQSQSQNKAQPKILHDRPPKQGEEPEDVKKHNEEMEKRADRPSTKVKEEDVEKDKVGKGWWSGEDGPKGERGGVSGGT